jgi:hypothetical protein
MSDKNVHFWYFQKLNFDQDQGWLTQIGLWAAFGIIAKNIEFLDHFMTKSAKT